MKNNYLYALLVWACFPAMLFSGNIYSFEDSAVPAGFSATNGSLSVGSDKYKLGSKSLRWQWNANSILSANNPANLSKSATNNNGGIAVWVYNTQPNTQPLKFAFYDAFDNEVCHIDFNLNFEGWRCLWATFRYDMGYNKSKSTLNNMKIIAPSVNSGTVYIDFLEFSDNVSWERISDFQYNLNQTNENIISFLDIRNTPVPLPVAPSAEQLQAFSTIEKRLNEWYLGTGKYSGNAIYQKREKALQNYINSAKNRVGNLNLSKEEDGTVTGTGLYPVTYQGTTVEGINMTTFRNISETYLIQLAYDYRRSGNSTSLETIQNIYDWYYNQGWADGSGLGSLRFEMLRSAGFYHSVFLLKDNLGDARFDRTMNTIRWYSMFGSAYATPETPGELADYIRTLSLPKLFYALSIKDESERNSAMQAYQRFVKNSFSKAPGFKGTMKPDYSGYHHNGAYYSAYYPDVLYTGCLIYYLLHDTPYALGEETYNDLKQALLTFRFFCGEFNVPAATTGRFPNQQTILHQLLPAFAYLGLSTDTPDREILEAFKRLWKPNENPMSSYIQKAGTAICFSSTLGEVELLLDFDSLGGLAEVNPSGTLYMPYSGLLIARQPTWMISAKGFSKYIWDYESSGTENIYGRYLSYGQLEYTDLENRNSSYNPANSDWNWNHVPGTTSKFLSYANLDYNKTNGKHRNFSDETFLGGIALSDNCAMFTNRVHDDAIDKSFYADKSVFVFDNLVYCIGSGINSQSITTPVYTTLFQNVLNTEFNSVYINDDLFTSDLSGIKNPTIKDNYGNVFIIQDGEVTVQKNNSCILAYINHGKIVTNKKYAYGWLIKPTDDQVENYKSDIPVTVVSQDDIAHAVYHKEKKTLAVSVFSSANPVNIQQIYSTSKPMMVMFSENEDHTFELAFSDPDMKRESAVKGDDITLAVAKQKGEATEISITLNGVYRKADTNENISVEVQGDKTIVTYPSAKEGETYRLKLKVEGQSIHESNKNQNHFFINSDTEYVTIHSLSDEPFECSVFDIFGRKLLSRSKNVQSLRISKSQLLSELIIIRIKNDKMSKEFKYINKN